jgi:hypothetical protein
MVRKRKTFINKGQKYSTKATGVMVGY